MGTTIELLAVTCNGCGAEFNTVSEALPCPICQCADNIEVVGEWDEAAAQAFIATNPPSTYDPDSDEWYAGIVLE